MIKSGEGYTEERYVEVDATNEDLLTALNEVVKAEAAHMANDLELVAAKDKHKASKEAIEAKRLRNLKIARTGIIVFNVTFHVVVRDQSKKYLFMDDTIKLRAVGLHDGNGYLIDKDGNIIVESITLSDERVMQRQFEFESKESKDEAVQ